MNKRQTKILECSSTFTESVGHGATHYDPPPPNCLISPDEFDINLGLTNVNMIETPVFEGKTLNSWSQHILHSSNDSK